MRTTNAVRSYADSWRATLKLVRSGFSWSGNERNCVFLNGTDSSLMDEARFSNASAISGLDFPDDGRAIAVVDWDQDGDLDLWLRNRTAPRLRLMLNSTDKLAPSANHLSLRLIGTSSNRDAVGARVQLTIQQANRTYSLLRSVRAGDGFLSQSSKRIHFGLPRTATIEQLTIFWPGAEAETISDVTAGGCYQITQGAGSAQKLNPRSTIALSPQKPITLKPTAAARIVLPGRIPLPPLLLESISETKPSRDQQTKQPTLILFWTPECSNCRQEFKELAQHEAEFRTAGLDILAVCLDGPKTATYTTTVPHQRKSSRFLQEINFPFPSVEASAESIDLLNDFQNALFSRFPNFVVPLCLMVDKNGHLISIYRGAFPITTFLQDAKLVDLSDHELRTLSAPLLGTWITQPATRAQFADFVAAKLLARQPHTAAYYYQFAAEVETNPESKNQRRERAQRLRQLIDGSQER
ncbi:MAG: ASPIC/UnbV domain-containing protein [Pirellulaceae bacterium]|nr:ASPIC/UnbV domain-containing protein [Pirellulaceae bacterium]